MIYIYHIPTTYPLQEFTTHLLIIDPNFRSRDIQVYPPSAIGKGNVARSLGELLTMVIHHFPLTEPFSGWWQLKYFWNFHPDPWGKDSHFD